MGKSNVKVDLSGLKKLEKNVKSIPKNQQITMPLPSNWEFMSISEQEKYKTEYATNVIKQQMFKGL